MVRWFHLVLRHAGKMNVYNSIREMFCHPNLKQIVDSSQWDTFTKNKLYGYGNGIFPARGNIYYMVGVHIYLIGYWKVYKKVRGVGFNAMTFIDHVSKLDLLIGISNEMICHIVWLYQNFG